MANVNIKVSYSMDKTGLQELNRILSDISVSARVPGQEMNQELQKAATTARQLSAVLDKSFNKDLGTINVTKFNQELLKTHLDMATIKKDLEGVADGSTAFNIISSSVLGATAQIKTANKALENMAVTLKNTIRYGISSSVFNTFTNSFQKAYDYSRQLNKSLNDIRIVTDMSADRMEDFAVTANEASKRLGANTLDYTNAALIYYQQGLSDQEAKARAEVTIKAANVTGQTGEEVSEQLTAVWNGYKVTADEAELYVDKLAAVAAGTAADLGELSVGMGKVASAANLMGVDVDQLNAQLATIVSVTRQAPESVGVALKTIYSRMGDIKAGLDDEVTLGKYTSQMAQYGINVLNANGQLRDMGEVIEEIGNKWTTMSREQQIALSQVMAGTRQYNNLLSLFDNWDMYTNALDMSANAMGTLQHQQDIYYESTEAHLKKLKATWQDLYKSMIDDDETHAGIDLLTNLIQTFDNFIDSFGGGMKSLAGLGTVFANVFNKQISTSIAGFLENQSKMEQNIELIEQKRQAILTGTSTVNIDTPQGQAELAGLETQLKYAEQIQQVENGITQEQNVQLTNLQNQIAELEKQAVLLEQQSKKEVKNALDDDEYEEYVKLFDKESEDQLALKEAWQEKIEISDRSLESGEKELQVLKQQTKELEKQLNGLDKVENINAENAKIQGTINKLIGDESTLSKENLRYWTNGVKISELSAKERAKILDYARKIVEEQEEENKRIRQGNEELKNKNNIIQQSFQTQQQANTKRAQAGLLNVEFENTIEQAQRATSIAEKVMGITGSLSTLAMTWSSINSLFQTLNDKEANIGDKITQTFMTIGMAIPMLLSGLNSLGKAFGLNTTIMQALNASHKAKIALDNADTALTKTRNADLIKEQILENALNKEHEKGNLLKITSVKMLTEEGKAKLFDAAATTADKEAVKQATIAQNAWNTSLLASPLLPFIAICMAAAAAIGIVTSAVKANNEAMIEKADKDIEEANKIQDEADSNGKLYDSLLKLHQQYKEGATTRDELEASIDSLVKKYKIEGAELDKLTGNYDALIEKIKQARTEELKGAKESAEDELKAAETKVKTLNYESSSHYGVNGPRELEFSQGLGNYNDENEMRNALKNNVSALRDLQGGQSRVTIPYPEKIEDQVKLYNELTAAKKEFINNTSAEIQNNSELYKDVDKYLEKLKDAINQYKQAQENVSKYTAAYEVANQNIDFHDVTDLKGYYEKRQQLFDKLHKATGKDVEELNKIIGEFIDEQYQGSLNKYEEHYKAVEEMVSNLGEQSGGELKKQLQELTNDEFDALQELFANNKITIDSKTSTEELKRYISQAQSVAQENSIQLKVDSSNSLYEKLEGGKNLTKDDKKELEELEKEYSELANIRNKNSDEYLQKLVGIREALEDELAVVKQLKTNEAIDLADSSLDELREAYQGIADEDGMALELDIDADTDKAVEAIQDVLDADYETTIAVKADMDSDYNYIVDTISEAEKMVAKIGEDFIVSNENLRDLNNAFPGILANITDLHDGTSRLSQEAVQTAMNDSKAIIATTTLEAVKRMKAEQQVALGKAESAEKIATLANQLAEDETMTEQDKATAIGQIQDELGKFKTEVDKKTNEKIIDNEVAVVDNANTNNQILTDNAAKAASSMAQNYQEYADQAIANIAAIKAAAEGGGGGTPTYSPISSHYTGNAGKSQKDLLSKYEGGKELKPTTPKDQLKSLADAAAAQAKVYRDIYDDYTGMIAELSSSVSDIDDIYRNAGAGKGGKSTSGLNKGNKGSGGKGSGSGSEKKPDQMEYLEKEIDRYHDVEIQLKQIETSMDKLNSQKDKLFGKDLISNINKQLSLLNKQMETTANKMDIAKNEAAELRNTLSEKGASFNSDGTIANYASVYASQLNYVNGLIAQYNSMSAEAQEGFKDTVEQAKKSFDNFVEDLNRYDEVVTDLIPGLETDIQSAIDEKIDLQIEKFDMEIEIRLELAEAERDWNDFKKKIIDEIEDDDILGNAMAKLVDFSSYYKENDTGIIQSLRKQVDNTLSELNQMDTNGWSEVYGDNRATALEDLKKYYEELMKNLEDVLDLQKEIHESYIDMMDEAQDKFDEQINSYEIISDLIDHDMQVISLVYGEESYSQLARYYDKQQQNFNNQLDFQRQQVDFWKAQLDALDEGSEAWENAKEKWEDAVGDFNKLIENSIQNLQDKYLNAINLIFQNLNNKITNNLGLDYVEEEWTLINKNADQYLDTINSLYEVQKLENKYLDALDNTDSISAQRQLKEIMDEELANLRERDKLTEYDIERANKRYEISLKQIALQEAQQNKTKMRLRRDSQGNYRYEYTADGDQIGQLQDELNDMYNSLYNFDKARYQDNLNQIYSVWAEFQEKMAEAAQINDPELRAEKELLLQTQYGELINGLVEQNATVRVNLNESAFEDLAVLYDTDLSNFQNMSDQEQEIMMNELIPYWESGIQHMTDVFAGEGGFLGVCQEAFEQLHEITRNYEEGLEELENVGRINFESIGEGIDENINRTQELIMDNTELINTYEEEFIAINNIIAQLDDLVGKYNSARDAAIAATKAAYGYWSAQQSQAADAAGQEYSGSGSGGNSSNTNSASSSSSGVSGGSGSGGSGDGNLVVGEKATFSGTYYYDSYGTTPAGSKYSGVTDGVVVDMIVGNPYGIHIHSADGKYPDLGWIKKSQLSGYDTGGYTGTWGNDGRLALLHQKELVLNKDDTANMLNAVNIMRNITNMLGSSILGKLATTTAGNFNTNIGNDTLEQNVHIDAQFPNVKDSREIEDALNNLVNMASMRVNKRR